MINRLLHFLSTWQGALFIYCIATVIALAPILIGGHILWEPTALTFGYPLFQTYTFAHLLSGDIFWHPLNMYGFPNFIVTGMSLNPFTYAFEALLPAFTDAHWFIAFQVIFGAFGCWLFLRKLGCSPAASLIGGFAYVTGNWWIVPLIYFSPALPMLPFLAWNLLGSTTHPRRALVLGTLLIGYTWLGGGFQISLMIITAYCIGCLALAWKHRKEQWKHIAWPLVHCFITTIIGSIIGIFKILPSWTYGLLSEREHGLSAAASTIEGITFLSPVRYLFPYADFPFLNFGNGLLGIYIGTFAFAFLIVGIFSWKQKSLRPWIVAYLFLLALAFNHSPVAAVVHSVPPFSYFRGAGRWMFLANFVAAVLCANGFDSLIANKAERTRKWLANTSLILLIIIVACFVLGQLVLLLFAPQITQLFQQYFAYFHDKMHLGPPLSYYTSFVDMRIQEFRASPLLLHTKVLLPLLALASVAIVLHKKIWARLSQVPLKLALIAILTSSIVLFVYIPNFRSADYPHSLATATFLQSHPGTAMGLFSLQAEEEYLVPYKPTKEQQLRWELEFLEPNINLDYNIPLLDYFDNLGSRRPAQLVSWVSGQWVTSPKEVRLVDMPGTLLEKTAEFVKRKDLVDMLGLQYIVSAVPLPSPSFTKVFETLVAPATQPVAIYENPSARPFAYFADSLLAMHEDEVAAFSTLTHEPWPNHRSLIEFSTNFPDMRITGAGSINVLSKTGSQAIIETKTNSHEWLIVMIDNLPGWTVTVDGQEIEPAIANGMFFGIPVDSGTHKVELSYSIWTMLDYGLKHL